MSALCVLHFSFPLCISLRRREVACMTHSWTKWKQPQFTHSRSHTNYAEPNGGRKRAIDKMPVDKEMNGTRASSLSLPHMHTIFNYFRMNESFNCLYKYKRINRSNAGDVVGIVHSAAAHGASPSNETPRNLFCYDFFSWRSISLTSSGMTSEHDKWQGWRLTRTKNEKIVTRTN